MAMGVHQIRNAVCRCTAGAFGEAQVQAKLQLAPLGTQFLPAQHGGFDFGSLHQQAGAIELACLD